MRFILRAIAGLWLALWRRFVGWLVGVLCGLTWATTGTDDELGAAGDTIVLAIVAIWLVFELRGAWRARRSRADRAAADAERERQRNEKAAARDASKLARELASDSGGDTA